MSSHAWRRLCVLGAALILTLATGCDDLVRRSVRDGVFSFVSGGITGSLSQNGAISDLLNNMFTGNLFGGTSNDTTAGV
jgi:hypothetical protein